MNQAVISCGYEELKPEQASIIISFVCVSDVFGCLPTGFGKSACLMLLPVIFDTIKARALKESIIILVSPLTSLMHDQVSKCRTRGLTAIAVTREEKSKEGCEAASQGNYQIVYISLEMLLGTKKWRSILQGHIYRSHLSAVVINPSVGRGL